jgi:hypothetical protein
MKRYFRKIRAKLIELLASDDIIVCISVSINYSDGFLITNIDDKYAIVKNCIVEREY